MGSGLSGHNGLRRWYGLRMEKVLVVRVVPGNGIAKMRQGRIPHGKENHPQQKEDGENKGPDDVGELAEQEREKVGDPGSARGGEEEEDPEVVDAPELVVDDGADNKKEENGKDEKQTEVVDAGSSTKLPISSIKRTKRYFS